MTLVFPLQVMLSSHNQNFKIMRKTLSFLLPLVLCGSCNLLDDGLNGPGETIYDENALISLKFSDVSVSEVKGNLYSSIDTNSFILTVTDAAGSILYDGVYSKSPESLIVSPGTYNIKVVSEKISQPAFDKPQWGDEQTVVVSSGQRALVELLCRQVNCGVKLHISSDFLTEYPSSALLLKGTEGKLMYSYSEKRTAYFCPGVISLVMSTGAVDETLLSRSLGKGEMLMLNINVPSSRQDVGGITMSVDITRVFYEETFTIGGRDSKGDAPDNAFTISQAQSNIGAKGVWVAGFVVGGDLTKSNINFDGPFKSASNLAIGPRASTITRTSCMSVELKDGFVRDGLNLVSHPDMQGRYIALKGDIDPSYFGLIGLKNVTDYEIL